MLSACTETGKHNKLLLTVGLHRTKWEKIHSQNNVVLEGLDSGWY